MISERSVFVSEEAMQQEKDIAAKSRVEWPDPIKISIWLVYEDGHWSALASEFDVVGMGPTQEAAMENLAETLGAYLAGYISEGAPFDAARRPIPVREGVRLKFRELTTRVLNRLPDGPQPRSDDCPRAVQHSKRDLTPHGFAHC
jgi:predicted RNase H-like HicB family nuclease